MSLQQKRRAVLAATAAAVAASTLSGLATVETAYAGCPREQLFGVTAKPYRIPFKDIPPFKDGPGGTLHVSKTAAYQVVAGSSAEVGAVLAKAKLEISASLGKSNTTSVINAYSHPITRRKYGNVRYVSYGKQVHWYRGYVKPDCSVVTTASGDIRYPTPTEGWYYWETKS